MNLSMLTTLRLEGPFFGLGSTGAYHGKTQLTPFRIKHLWDLNCSNTPLCMDVRSAWLLDFSCLQALENSSVKSNNRSWSCQTSMQIMPSESVSTGPLWQLTHILTKKLHDIPKLVIKNWGQYELPHIHHPCNGRCLQNFSSTAM